jgi:hypothetical protein
VRTHTERNSPNRPTNNASPAGEQLQNTPHPSRQPYTRHSGGGSGEAPSIDWINDRRSTASSARWRARQAVQEPVFVRDVIR